MLEKESKKRKRHNESSDTTISHPADRKRQWLLVTTDDNKTNTQCILI